MQNLPMCRVCLHTDVQHVVKSLQLQEVYEKLTSIPTDMRPLVLCYICFAQLKASHRFMLKCLKAEQMLDQLLTNKDGVLDLNLIDRSDFKQLTISLVEPITFESTVQNDDIIGLETLIIYEDDVKIEEHTSTQETANSIIDSEPDSEHSPSDSVDDVSLNNIETAAEQEAVRVKKNQPTRETKKGPISKKSNHKPEINKSTQVKKNGYTNLDNARNEASESKHKDDVKYPVLNDNIESNSKTNLEKKYICQQNVLKQGFTENSDLIRYERIYTGEKPYVCNVCNMGFTVKSHLVRHERIHTGEKPYVCNVCNKGFNRNSHLVSHERIHTGEKPYVCNVCNKDFTQKSHLVNHKRSHTGEKPYICNVCNKNFNRKGHLVTHERIHTGEKPYVCNVCNKDFTQKSHLVNHKRSHTRKKPYVCKVCNKDFTHKSDLVKHKPSHTGEKPYVCNVCNKSFTQKRSLVYHKRIHTGEKPYVCHVCMEGFARKSVLIRHVRTH